MNIAAIPTLFNGIMYRSRLEAKWASFFLGVGWRADYEPNDWNGYIPDFRVGHTYFEVKPYSSYDEPAANKAIRAVPFGPDCAEAKAFVLLRDCPVEVPNYPFCRSIGWYLNSTSSAERDTTDCLVMPAIIDGGATFACYLATWGKVSFTIDPVLPNTAFGLGHIIDDRWAKACNAAQWKASA